MILEFIGSILDLPAEDTPEYRQLVVDVWFLVSFSVFYIAFSPKKINPFYIEDK